MVSRYIEVVVQLTAIGIVIAAAGLWAGAGVDTRPKYRDEQTLIGGTIWSQIIIPIGLMISKIVGELIDPFVRGYFLITGMALLTATGIVLIVHEVRIMKKRQRRESRRRSSGLPVPAHSSLGTYDKIYYAIGVLCILAAALKLSEFVLFIVLGAG